MILTGLFGIPLAGSGTGMDARGWVPGLLSTADTGSAGLQRTAMRWRRRGVEAGNGCTRGRVWPGGRAHGDDSVAKRACGHKPFSFTALVAGCRGGRREGRSPPCEEARGRPSHRWAGMMSSPPTAPFPAARRRCFHRRGLRGGGRRWFLLTASGLICNRRGTGYWRCAGGLRGGFQPPVRGSAGPCSPGRERLYI